ncbi:hypothetical protein [uncultured Sphingomonas sp.]|uniref:hypothetical protein n=1 Tax=uncultured Sphingomonas sp. TaxID=158754 RepID=UPI003747A526
MLQFSLSNAIKLGRNATLTQEVDGTYQSKITLITGSIPSIEDDGYLGVQSRHLVDRDDDEPVSF